jgi:uncharacterized membrane protein YdbT with pleckstrin-like domain
MGQPAQPAQPLQPVQPPQPARAAEEGERIVYQGKLHWAIYVRPVMVSCLAILLFSYGEPLFGAAATIGAGLLWAAALMSGWGSVFLITERRVIIRAGSVYRVSLDLALEQVEAVQASQDTMGRLLGYGTLRIDGSDGSRAVCPTVARAAEFSRQLKKLRGPL